MKEKIKNEIIIFDDQNVKLEVNMKDETVWLSLEQISKLFDRDRTVITRHINNIFKSEELDRKEVCAKFAHTTSHGALNNKTQTRELDYYNLDMIISIGYRVNNKKGIVFRKWATSILKDYMIKGYTVNQKRLNYLEKTVQLLDIANRNSESNNEDIKEILTVINSYSKALNLLDDYDHKSIKKVNGNVKNIIIKYEDCLEIINKLKFNNESQLFALEKDFNFESIINDIYQSFDGKDLYPTSQEKCANILYLTIKNHAFIDGNKRIAATIFIYFLQRYNLLYKDGKQIIDNNTLTAISLLIAESNPREKEILIDLILHFLN